MKQLISMTAFLTTLAGLYGCGGVPPTYYYRIHDPVSEASPKVNNNMVLPVTLGVAQCTADLLYESDQIVYRDSPYQVQFYHYRRWVAPPRRIVTEKLYKDLRASGAFEDVVRIPTPRSIDYALRGRIVAFEEVDEGDQWFGLVSLELLLQRTENDDVIWERVLTRKTPVQKRSPDGVVQAISESLSAVIEDALGEIGENLKAQSLGSH